MDESVTEKRVKLHIVEDHNEVLEHIYRAIGSKVLQFSDLTILHIDSHPDMLIPQELRASRIFEKEYLLDTISIENWIIPAVYAGHFSLLVWLKPFWAQQMKNQATSFLVGQDTTTDSIRVTLKDDYYLSELLYNDPGSLVNTKNLNFIVATLNEDSVASELSSLNCLSSICSTSFVLDIDLDFFSTQNPFLALYTEQELHILKCLYRYTPPADSSDMALKKCLKAREQQLARLKNNLHSLSQGNGLLPGDEDWIQLRDLYACFKDKPDVDWLWLHEIGCTFDNSQLPHHINSETDISKLIGSLQHVLLLLPVPAIITIARSSMDDYCPKSQVEYIQKHVLEMLQSCYSHLTIIKHYEESF